MSCETRTDSAGREVSACTLAPGGGAVVHAWHSNLAPFPPHSLCRPPAPVLVRPSARPSTRLSYNCGQRSKWQWAMLYPRSLARLHPRRFCMDGWPARPLLLPACSGALDGLSAPPSSAFRATNYHTFGSDSVVRVRPCVLAPLNICCMKEVLAQVSIYVYRETK